jgi:RNA polymerase primary sigma factor
MDDRIVRQLSRLIEAGKEKGCVLYEDIDDLLPEGYLDGREIDEILSQLEKAGVRLPEEPHTAQEPVRDMADLGGDPVSVYLNEVRGVPPLPPGAEADLVKRIQDGGEDAEAARKDLVEANLDLVVSIARRYTRRGIHILDLIIEGNTALLNASHKFDSPRAYKFSTYVSWLVRRTLIRATTPASRP